jgi:uncharacterized damage-inducible protein DinB
MKPDKMIFMTDNERQEILASLENGSAVLLETLHGVTDELAVRVPAPGKWSILQCVEHVAVVEDYLFGLILASKQAETPVINAQRELLIASRGADRTNRRESPEGALPTGRFSTLSEAVQHLLASRARTIQFVQTNNEDLRARIATHPLMGPVNCQELLLLMAVHPVRHAKQIDEIKAAAA